MNNSQAILIFCGRLRTEGSVPPLEIREWAALSAALRGQNIEPAELLEFSLNDLKSIAGLENGLAERLMKLTERSERLFAELAEYENEGVGAVTVADANYPARLKSNLGANCPPVLYWAGDMSFLKGKCAGFVGSRKAEEQDEIFTRATVRRTASCGYGVVSGGARGVDLFAESEGIKLGVGVVEFPSEGLIRRLNTERAGRAVQDGSLLLLSATLPLARFSAQYAIARNRYIYAQSFGTVVVRSDYGKGGTWSGATDNLKHGFCAELCWNNAEYVGNTALIARGAIPIDESFNGELSRFTPPHMPKQTTLF